MCHHISGRVWQLLLELLLGLLLALVARLELLAAVPLVVLTSLQAYKQGTCSHLVHSSSSSSSGGHSPSQFPRRRPRPHHQHKGSRQL